MGRLRVCHAAPRPRCATYSGLEAVTATGGGRSWLYGEMRLLLVAQQLAREVHQRVVAHLVLGGTSFYRGSADSDEVRSGLAVWPDALSQVIGDGRAGRPERDDVAGRGDVVQPVRASHFWLNGVDTGSQSQAHPPSDASEVAFEVGAGVLELVGAIYPGLSHSYDDGDGRVRRTGTKDDSAPTC